MFRWEFSHTISLFEKNIFKYDIIPRVSLKDGVKQYFLFIKQPTNFANF